jgi:hypothetical protein
MASCTFSITVDNMSNDDLDNEDKLARTVYAALKDVKLGVSGSITDCEVLEASPDDEEEEENED